MKKQSASRSAFFNPRVLIGFLLCSIGLLLALAGLSKSMAGAVRHETTVQTSGSWTSTGSLNVGRRGGFTATLLSNGKVLLAGGCIENSGDPYCNGSATTGAELYDPSTGIWTPTGSMLTPRQGHTATLLADGRVLVTGGQLQACLSNSSAELYDPSTGLWTATGSMNSPRSRHFATLITSGSLQGMVLAGGGYINQNDGGCGGTAQLATAELYDPATGLWSPTSDLTKARDYPTALAFPGGSVLVLGTLNCCPYHWFNSAESYNSDTGLWTPTSSRTTAANGAETGLLDGKVIVVGGTRGTQPTSVNVPDAELFDPATGGWTGTASMSTDRAGHSLSLLANGQVLVAGGFSGGWGICNDLKSAELYDPNSGTWSITRNMTIARNSHTATLLPNGQVLVASGTDCEGHVLSSAELYNPSSGGGSCLPPPTGLVSWWSGDRTADDVQGTNNGTLRNGTSFRKGMVGPAFSFDGVDDYVQIPHNASLNPGTGDFSVNFWMKTDTLDTQLALLSKRDVCNAVSFWGLIMLADGTIEVEIYDGLININTFSSDISVNDGIWHHVALVRQTTTATLYIDGAVHGSGSTEGITIVANTAPVRFATDVCVGVNGSTQFYSGELDEIQYLNAALTSSQVQDIYNAGAEGQCKPEIFVSSIDPSYSVVHSQFLVTTSVAIQDTNGIAPAGATVNVKTLFPNGTELGFSAVTDESGNASISFHTGDTGLYKFKIRNVSLSGRTYDASLNVETSDTLVIP